ncbi:MAG: Dna2/Cas4 domain-containing protein [Methanosarcinales archaeon]|nr:Dna2/Cas4 domain-containing protein [Methanosarcinales archaeon]
MKQGRILASEIAAYLRCPRLVYFRSQLVDDEQKIVDTKYLTRLILKELALTHHRTVACDGAGDAGGVDNTDNAGDADAVDEVDTVNDMIGRLRTELKRIVDELLVLYRAELSGVDRQMVVDAADSIDIDVIGSQIAEYVRIIGKDTLLTKITPCAVEHTMYSDALGIAGAPDKLVRIDGGVLPYLVRTGEKPDQGTWKPDRLQITACAMLVEETFGQVVKYGTVEYARFFELREVSIRSKDRRRVLELRNRIRRIKDGRMPDRPRDAPCEFCAFEEDCTAQRSLASKFF